MAESSRHLDGARLERELEDKEFWDLLAHLQRGEPFLRQFSTWGNVIAFMRHGTSRDPRKDEILRPILMANEKDKDHHWRTILLVIFWPGLMSIHRKKRHWDKNDPDELLQRIFWAFLQTICGINLKHRSDRFVQWIYNTTLCRLRDEYRRDWRRAAREVRSESGPIEQVADLKGIDFEGIERRIGQKIEIESLREHLVAGRIKEAAFLLIIGTRVYDQTLAEYARGVGLSTEAAKKRRQRAETAIRNCKNEMQ